MLIIDLFDLVQIYFTEILQLGEGAIVLEGVIPPHNARLISHTEYF